MKTFGDKKKEAEYLKELLNEEVLCGKLDAIKICLLYTSDAADE